MLKKIVKQIDKAAIYDLAIKTPLKKAPKLSHRLKNTVLFKREDLQPVFSFKIRGAYHKMKTLTQSQRDKGIIAASAGNHAQGIAISAHQMGITPTIVMPTTTPLIKINACLSYGAKVVTHGDAYDDAYTKAQQLVEKNDMTFIHPYDDLNIIAGQGTIGKEILQQCPTPDVIFVPVGGGGLLAGILAYIKEHLPNTKIVCVEPQDAPCMTQSLKEGKRTTLEQVGIFVDGVAVRQPGRLPFEIVKPHLTPNDCVLVTTDEICAAMKDIFDDTRVVAEPAGALALAGLKKYVAYHHISNQTLVTIQSGANINFDRLRYISERAIIGEDKEAIFAVQIPEIPGSFKAFCKLLGKRSITEFNYRYSDSEFAQIFVGVEFESAHLEKIDLFKMLIDTGYQVVDLTDNEMAKLHVRHMVGGHADGVPNERLFRFEFPERPGALLQFLSKLGDRWNISLFHYRNHGAAYGRVLVGIQIPDSEMIAFEEVITSVGYPFFDESDNPVFNLFLK